VLLDFRAGQVADLHFRIHLEHRIEREQAFRGLFLFGDLGLACDSQLGLIRRLGKGFAHLVVHDFVVDGITVPLRHDVHRHLARPEPVHLDGTRQALQAGIDF
jgi:hypothetical protein